MPEHFNLRCPRMHASNSLHLCHVIPAAQVISLVGWLMHVAPSVSPSKGICSMIHQGCASGALKCLHRSRCSVIPLMHSSSSAAAADTPCSLGTLTHSSQITHGVLCKWCWSVQRHSGLLTLTTLQVVLEFPEAFWASDFDYFGAAVDGGPEMRGRCFMFWNCHRFCGVPILTSIISGGFLLSCSAAAKHEQGNSYVSVYHAALAVNCTLHSSCLVHSWSVCGHRTAVSYNHPSRTTQQPSVYDLCMCDMHKDMSACVFV